MSSSDKQRLNRKYLAIAVHLKACWAFEQFLQRLRRSLPERAAPPERIDFGPTYKELKQIAANVEALEPQSLEPRLATVEDRLLLLAARLREEDNKLSPADLRRFIGRVRRLDEEVILELLQFYIFASRRHAWDADLTDKVDFLLSRLGEQISGPALNQNRVRLNACLLHLWDLAHVQPPQPAVIAALRNEVAQVARTIHDFAELVDLQKSGVIARYRKIKHGLGSAFIEPSVAQAILKTNLALGKQVQQLYDKEEWAIAAGFSKLTDLEESSGFSEFLSLELDSLRLDIERLEEGRRHDDVRIDTVRRLREQADEVLSRLSSPEQPDPTVQADRDPVGSSSPRATGEFDLQVATRDRLANELLDRMFGQLETLLVETGTVQEADAVLQDPGLPLDLERPEVEAYLRLRDGSSPDPDLDRFLLTGAALRLRLSILHHHLASGASGLVEMEAAAALELAEEFLERFRSLILELEEGGPNEESSGLRFLEVRLMGDYSSLWLEVNSAGS